MRRVVISGLGIVSCLGNDKESVTRSLHDGISGIRFNQEYQDIGMRLLERIRDDLADVAVVEHMPKLEGRQMVMVLAPKRK